MKEDDDNITEAQDDRNQKIVEKFQKEGGSTGTSEDRNKILLSTVTRKNSPHY